jgi:hypothetical protein
VSSTRPLSVLSPSSELAPSTPQVEVYDRVVDVLQLLEAVENL